MGKNKLIKDDTALELWNRLKPALRIQLIAAASDSIGQKGSTETFNTLLEQATNLLIKKYDREPVEIRRAIRQRAVTEVVSKKYLG